MSELDRTEEGLRSVKLAVQRSRAMAFVGMWDPDVFSAFEGLYRRGILRPQLAS